MPDAALPSLDATTRLCAVLGHPIRHSASPAMHNAALATLGLNWRYLAFDVAPDHLHAAIEGARAMRFIGLNLTVPHKLLVMEWVDVLDNSARTWGAVNTIRFEAQSDGAADWQPLARVPAEAITAVRTHGFNTDADAIVRALREDLACDVRGATVLVLGAGGAGRTAALRLAAEGARELFLVNRTEAKAAEVAGDIGRRFPGVRASPGYPTGPVDLVLNATSLGLNESDPLPMDGQRFELGRAGCVYDMVYRPAETKLLRTARAAGRPAANGLGMLLYQGAAALEIWTGQPAPVAVMRAALQENVYGTRTS